MDKNSRIRKVKALLWAQKLVTKAAEEGTKEFYRIRWPGRGLNTSKTATSLEGAINQAIQEWVNNRDFVIEELEDNVDVVLTAIPKSTRIAETVSLSKEQVRKAYNGDKGYVPFDLGGYSSEGADLSPIIPETEEQTIKLSPMDQMVYEKFVAAGGKKEVVKPKFSAPTILMTDPTGRFLPQNINMLVRMGNQRAWMAIPTMLNKGAQKIPYLYAITGEPSLHEKYFGIKTEFGYIDTPASFFLRMLAMGRRKMPGKDLRESEIIEVPQDHKDASRLSKNIITLGAEMEELATYDSVEVIDKIGGRTDLLRELAYNKQDHNFYFTWSHQGSGRLQLPGTGPDDLKYGESTAQKDELFQELSRRVAVMNLGVNKPLNAYPKLGSMTQEFVQAINQNIEELLREQHAVNRTSRMLKPSGKREEVDDVLRNIIIRKIVDAIKESDAMSGKTDLGNKKPLWEG